MFMESIGYNVYIFSGISIALAARGFSPFSAVGA